MTKRKADKFSVTKAVKANAREQVGQPRPARAILPRPKNEQRGAKHKSTLEDTLRRED